MILWHLLFVLCRQSLTVVLQRLAAQAGPAIGRSPQALRIGLSDGDCAVVARLETGGLGEVDLHVSIVAALEVG